VVWRNVGLSATSRSHVNDIVNMYIIECGRLGPTCCCSCLSACYSMQGSCMCVVLSISANVLIARWHIIEHFFVVVKKKTMRYKYCLGVNSIRITMQSAQCVIVHAQTILHEKVIGQQPLYSPNWIRIMMMMMMRARVCVCSLFVYSASFSMNCWFFLHSDERMLLKLLLALRQFPCKVLLSA